MEVKAAAVENTGRIFETERLIWVYSVGMLLMSLLRIKSTFMQKQFLTLSVSFTLDKAKQCSEYLLLLWKEKKSPNIETQNSFLRFVKYYMSTATSSNKKRYQLWFLSLLAFLSHLIKRSTMSLLPCPSVIAIVLALHDEGHSLINQYLLLLLLTAEIVYHIICLPGN